MEAGFPSIHHKTIYVGWRFSGCNEGQFTGLSTDDSKNAGEFYNFLG